MRRLIPALATIVLASFGMVPAVHAGDSDTEKRCFGQAPTVVGTSGDDVISVSAFEAGAVVHINGERRPDLSTADPIAIVSGAGNDKISFGSDGGGTAVVCSGKGNDDLDGTMVSRASTGPGKDRVSMYLQCEVTPDVYGAETVKITGFDSVEEGPCN